MARGYTQHEEGADVYSDGKCVYHAVAEVAEEAAKMTSETAEEDTLPAEAKDDTVDGQPVKKQPAEGKPEKAASLYRLKALMNVRKKPHGEIVRTLSEDTVVEVIALENDWLYLADGTFILYRGGEFAEKI